MTELEGVYGSLLKQAVTHLKAWHQKYGQNGPGWLPPNGDALLIETIEDWLTASGNCAAVKPLQPPKTPVYQAAHELIAHIGYHGEIDSRHPLTQALLYALNDFDAAIKAD